MAISILAAADEIQEILHPVPRTLWLHGSQISSVLLRHNIRKAFDRGDNCCILRDNIDPSFQPEILFADMVQLGRLELHDLDQESAAGLADSYFVVVSRPRSWEPARRILERFRGTAVEIHLHADLELASSPPEEALRQLDQVIVGSSNLASRTSATGIGKNLMFSSLGRDAIRLASDVVLLSLIPGDRSVTMVELMRSLAENHCSPLNRGTMRRALKRLKELDQIKYEENPLRCRRLATDREHRRILENYRGAMVEFSNRLALGENGRKSVLQTCMGDYIITREQGQDLVVRVQYDLSCISTVLELVRGLFNADLEGDAYFRTDSPSRRRALVKSLHRQDSQFRFEISGQGSGAGSGQIGWFDSTDVDVFYQAQGGDFNVTVLSQPLGRGVEADFRSPRSENEIIVIMDARGSRVLWRASSSSLAFFSHSLTDSLVRNHLKELVLTYLSHAEQGGADLVRAIWLDFGLQMASGTIYPLLHRLEEEELIQKTSLDNSRSLLYGLTTTGKQIASEMIESLMAELLCLGNWVGDRIEEI